MSQPLEAFALASHPWDFLAKVTDSLAAITSLAGGARLADLNDTEQAGYHGLVDRLVTLQRELLGVMKVAA